VVREKSRSGCLDLDELLARVGGNGVASIAAVLNVKLDGFPDVVQSGARIAASLA
jgi:hypothetical protein